MMNKKLKLETLKEIARQFNEEGITWALGASMLMYFNGLLKDFEDIDIMVIEKDVAVVKDILLKMGNLQLSKKSNDFKTKVYLNFDINGVKIDVMAGFAIVTNEGVIDCSLKQEQITGVYNLDGIEIPLQSVELWLKYYELMGRKNKADLIRNSKKL